MFPWSQSKVPDVYCFVLLWFDHNFPTDWFCVLLMHTYAAHLCIFEYIYCPHAVSYVQLIQMHDPCPYCCPILFGFNSLLYLHVCMKSLLILLPCVASRFYTHICILGWQFLTRPVDLTRTDTKLAGSGGT